MNSDLARLISQSANVTVIPCLHQVVAIVFCLKLRHGFFSRPWDLPCVFVLLNRLEARGRRLEATQDIDRSILERLFVFVRVVFIVLTDGTLVAEFVSPRPVRLEERAPRRR
jgi:hypothetical protein